ncbi:MAG TPA: hypothetical protein ENK57_16445 [Polyangiaceae bacterium]|nr:hypothetical protein [Polyangiaceae bacterium]
MTARSLLALPLAALLSLGCGGDVDTDGGTPPGMDGGVIDRDSAVPPGTDGGPSEADGGGGGCVPTIEICGDRIDQDCDGRDTGCGDGDGDGIMACRAGDDLTMCDCDDSRTDVRPAFGAVPGAPELCDGRDNNCNGRIDESAECCAGCADVSPRSRADICNEDGACDCSTEPGIGACPAGQDCCAGGCVDLQTDATNCGFCGSACTVSADRCTAGNCACGSGPVCDRDRVCSGGSC